VETDASVPVVDGPWAYYRRTREGSDYPIHCRRPAAGLADPTTGPLDAATALVDPANPPADEQVIMDQTVLAERRAYRATGGMAVDDGHRLLAYLIDTDGDERYAVRIRALDTGADIAQVTDGASYGLAWTRDGSHLYYLTPDGAWRPHRLWRHRVGGPG